MDTFQHAIFLDNDFNKITQVGQLCYKIKCIKIKPKAVADRVFKNDESITLWVSDDENKIPIRVEASLAVGSLKVDLTSYKGLKNSFSAKVK